MDYHSRLIIVATPVINQIYAAGQRLVLLNRHQVSACRGLIATGAAGTGKTTEVTQLGGNNELLLRHRLGQQAMAGRMPVAYVTVPPAATPKILASEFARFAGRPVHGRQNQLKYLAERIPAIVYAGINVQGSGLFAGIRGQQIVGRLGVIACDSFAYGTVTQRQHCRR